MTNTSSDGRAFVSGSNRSGGSFDTSEQEKALEKVDEQLADGAVWNDQARAAELNRRRAELNGRITRGKDFGALLDDIETLEELSKEGESVDEEIGDCLARLDKTLTDLEVSTMLSGKDDRCNAFVEIHPGAGGVDAQDWAEMLLRMYERWAEQTGFTAELLERQDGDEAGIKSATLRLVGGDAYGWAKAERGVHRLVRISPFDAQKRRHTAFASVDVTPEVDDDIEVVIEDKDLRIDTYRSSGAGGQHVNVTDSAVRITHMPSGIVVACQDERSQHRNREKAMRVLRSRLYEREVREREEKLRAEAGDKMEIGFGSQIRSYVLAPYRMVKDVRTGMERGDVERVLDGDLTPFMKAYLLARGQS